jgi:hypothetical protein
MYDHLDQCQTIERHLSKIGGFNEVIQIKTN